MHFLAMNHNDQIATDGYNGQVFNKGVRPSSIAPSRTSYVLERVTSDQCHRCAHDKYFGRKNRGGWEYLDGSANRLSSYTPCYPTTQFTFTNWNSHTKKKLEHFQNPMWIMYQAIIYRKKKKNTFCTFTSFNNAMLSE